MRNFLANKNNVAVSAYITDKNPYANPAQITTNGAITIIDNSDYSQNIDGLVPNTYSIFLDNLFLASGYGFSSYNNYEKASYIINTNEGAINWIVNEINDIHNQPFDLELDQNADKKINKIYNTYGWLKEYTEIKIEQPNLDNNFKHIIKLNKQDTCFISEINVEVIGGKNLQMESSDDLNDLSFNYFEIGETATVHVNFIKGNNSVAEPSFFHETAPEIYLNVTNEDTKQIILNSDNIENNGNLLYFANNYSSDVFANKDLSLTFKRHDDIIYDYTFKNILKWRYKILPFHTERVNLFGGLDTSYIYALDYYNFSDVSFTINDVNNQSNSNSIDSITPNTLSNLYKFINDNLNNSIYLDDEMGIEFSGFGYNKDGINNYIHDYFVIEKGVDDLEFYFNGIKNNHWNYFEFSLNNKDYRLYQSPQRYIGKHTWTIKYNYE